MQIEQFPRVRLAAMPTPLEPLPRLSEALGGPRIYVKRDDQTGLAMGGNKARKLEFLMADAIARGCDMVVTTGGVQSNHARQTAAAAARLGLECELLLPRLVDYAAAEYENSGNVLLDRLLGARLFCPPAEEFSSATIDARLNALAEQGKRPYFIPTGGSTPLGALGYVNAAFELVQQAHDQGVAFDWIIVPTGSAGTHAGIVAGLLLAGYHARVLGMAVSGTAADKQAVVRSLAEQALQLLSANHGDLDERVVVDDRFVGPGYGLPTEGMVEAVQTTARLEGLLLDPVYTGKAMAGVFAAVRCGKLTAADNVLFWHTGGTPALFAYQRLFS